MRRPVARYDAVMRRRCLAILGVVLLTPCQTTDGPYARIAILHPRDGQTIDFEAGYIRHLTWHQQAGDKWVWYGWTVTFGERQRWFVYATFGHSAASFDSPVPPADDERDNVLNVAPHVDSWANALYEYLPRLSRGTGTPRPAPRVELTTVTPTPGATKAFEAALASEQSQLKDETLWYRLIAGSETPGYLRLRPRASLSDVIDGWADQALSDNVSHLTAKTTVEILTLRPAMSLGVTPSSRD